MADGTAKPVIFISYSHKDEPEHPRGEEVQWLSFVRTYLQPAVRHGVFDLWDDQSMPGGTDWDPEIEKKLRACDIFILLVSANSMASNYIVDKEIAIIRERQAKGEPVHFYPLLLTPTPKAGRDKVKDKNLRPRDARPFSGYSLHDRAQHMTDAADEIAALVEKIAVQKTAERPSESAPRPAYVHITGLPETAYERLVGRDYELKVLDGAWNDSKTNILSLVAEGGAGKSALVNEWLKRLQADNYRGAEAVLGWSFYSQGSKERATSAEEFLNWALGRLELKVETTSATAKGEAVAEESMKRRVLLVLDGVEPLQHGLDSQLGQLKDQGLRALLRRFAAMPLAEAHGLIVVTSRLPINDIARWEDGAALVERVDKLSDDAGAALLRDNGVWGTDKELKAAAHNFGGHPLALGLLASFLKETQTGDVRRRDHIRAFFADPENPRHDHAKRVMESYEKEWLAGQPPLLAIMHTVGLFDRPASDECLNALRAKPVIKGLTDEIVNLDDSEWQRAVARLREVRLLLPRDPTAPDALDAHPLVREWFGERLRQTNETAWKAAHGRLYEHLLDTTEEGDTPTLEDLAPLYQAIAHGCRARRHQQALDEIYKDRICRRLRDGGLEYYALYKLGAFGSDMAAISWFFDKPYATPAAELTTMNQAWALGVAAFALRAQGRFAEALAAMRVALRMAEDGEDWRNAAVRASNLSETELLAGEVAGAVTTAEQSVAHADRSGEESDMIIACATSADALHAAGRREEAARAFADAEQRQENLQRETPLLYSLRGYKYCDLLLAAGDHAVARDRAVKTIMVARGSSLLLDIALDTLTLGRGDLGLALVRASTDQMSATAREDARTAHARLDEAVDSLRAAGQSDDLPRGLLARATFRRSIGDWDGAARDLDEVEEIAEPGPMRLYLCDMARERARLAFAEIEAFAPLNGMLENDNPPKPVVPSPEQIAELKTESEQRLKIAADYIATCGYHRRDEELAELQAVLRGDRKFADLPPRV
jgi:tetratricopeptide (TPR) repeat protein